MFLCLFAGGQVQQLPSGLTGEEGAQEAPTQARFDREKYEEEKQISRSIDLSFSFRQRYRHLRGKSLKKSRTWIMEKKDRWRTKGRQVSPIQPSIFLSLFFSLSCRDVRPDSKYTARKRPKAF